MEDFNLSDCLGQEQLPIGCPSRLCSASKCYQPLNQARKRLLFFDRLPACSTFRVEGAHGKPSRGILIRLLLIGFPSQPWIKTFLWARPSRMGLENTEPVMTSLPATVPTDLADLVDRFGSSSPLSPEWLWRLHLEQPRRGIRCLHPLTRCLKRLVDIVGATTLLLLLAPVMLLVAVLIVLTSPGPVIFRQTRTGLNKRGERTDRRQENGWALPNGEERRRGEDRRQEPAFGKPFVLYKFRTMRLDAEKNGPQLAAANDPRITLLGRFLRKTRLDEIPQLWNVLRGEMSLVGPRPSALSSSNASRARSPAISTGLVSNPASRAWPRSSTATTPTRRAFAARWLWICSTCKIAACGTISRFWCAPWESW